jgi:hypothetical protein
MVYSSGITAFGKAEPATNFHPRLAAETLQAPSGSGASLVPRLSRCFPLGKDVHLRGSGDFFSFSSNSRRCRSSPRARCMRLRTVPTGQPMIAAIS